MRVPDKIVPIKRCKHIYHCMKDDYDFNYSKKEEIDGFMCEYWSNGVRLGVIHYTMEELSKYKEMGIVDLSVFKKD